MSYIGQQPVVGRYILLDQISGGFNGTATGFTMAAGGQGVLPGLAQNVLLSLGGVIQQPGVDYLISGSGLTFTTAPVAGTTFFATVLGDMQAVGTPSDGTVLPASIASSGTFVFPNVTTTGTTLIASGTAAAPSLAVIGDVNTGLYSPGADQLAISTGGTGRLFVDASGRLGLGTSSPSSPLHVVGSLGIEVTNLQVNNSAKSGRYTTTHYTTTEEPICIAVGFGNASESQVRIGGGTSNLNAATSVEFYTAANTTTVTGTERARIDSSGRLLVGADVDFGGGKHQVGNGNINIGTYIGAAVGTYELIFNKARSSTIGTNTVVAANDLLGQITFKGADGTNQVTAALIKTEVDGTPGANDMPGRLVFSTTADGASSPTERLRIDSSGRLLVGKSTATGAAIFQVQTPTTLSTTNDEGVEFTNTSAKVYPTTANFGVIAGLSQNIELSTAQVIDTVTPGGFNFVYGIQNVLTKSAGNTQDIERLYFNGFNQTFTWADANTCKQYLSFTDIFNYSGYNANSRTSSSFAANTVSLNAPDTRTQTIANITSNSLRVAPAGTSTVAITSWASQSPGLLLLSASTGTKTCTLTDAVFYDTSTIWGTSVTTGTLAATITNLFGLRLRPPASTTGLTITNNWGLYQEWSLAKNWFAGASNQYPNITTTASGANAFLDSANSNRLYRSTSSLTYKRDVEDLDSNLADQILNLRPVWYRSKCDSDCQDWSWYGLIAEEVAEIDPRFVHYGYQEDAYEFIDVTETVELPLSDPRRKEGIETEEITRQERQLKADAQQVPNGVAYERLVVPLLDIIKRQKSQLELIEARLAALEAR
jgi:hypothetical protein